MWSLLYEYDNGVQTDVLNVPVDKPVKLNMRSVDVIHSFYIPAFKVKQDVVPGIDGLYLWFTPRQKGEYDVFCAEYCGLQHSSMLSTVVVMDADEFDSWYAAEGEKYADMQAALEEGGNDGDALVSIGKTLAGTKGCIACHSSDGSRLVGPSFKGVYGRSEVVTRGGEEYEITADDDYLRRSILAPNEEIVKGYQALMPSMEGMLSDEELDAIIAYIKSLR
jgi:cytochrome c oxidase subunit 2